MRTQRELASLAWVWTPAQQMVVTLYRETLESSLIKAPVAHCPVRDAPAYRVDMREPSKIVRQLAVLVRPGDKMPMVG